MRQCSCCSTLSQLGRGNATACPGSVLVLPLLSPLRRYLLLASLGPAAVGCTETESESPPPAEASLIEAAVKQAELVADQGSTVEEGIGLSAQAEPGSEK